MASPAHVKNLESLEGFAMELHITQNELVRFAEAIRIELDRITDHLEREAPAYWKQQFQRSQQKLEIARAALSRCEQVTREDERRSCLVEKKQFVIAQHRVKFCEERLRTLKSVCQQWQQQRLKTQTHLQQLFDVAETGLPAAQSALNQVLIPLRQYAQIEQP
jgi:hypothetical protein